MTQPQQTLSNRSCQLGEGTLLSAAFSTEPDSSIQIQTLRTERLTFVTRLTIAIAGSGLMLLLTIAAWLEPSPAGLGTHQQLGLPPCTFRVLFGARCPSCGMTTAWANVMNAQMGEAVSANVGGTLLAILALMATPWLLLSAATGRWLLVAPNDLIFMLVAALFVAVTLVDWAWRMLAA